MEKYRFLFCRSGVNIQILFAKRLGKEKNWAEKSEEKVMN